ncbi:uncharacterized protein LOC118787648 [Megalops cyprinoides]|uniref:uncharacterized protein LOC118787648 n=1 Tax=Megalops cyprinoides TaxID=118141 RepID=UPI00186551F1|nr:uncharacterized protein LOC118787648 [Megalops cyprinoides]
MKGVTGEETQSARKDVFGDYLNYYEQVWPQGDLKLCKDARVTKKAKCVLLAERSPEARFTAFDFYRTATECMRKGRKEWRNVLSQLIKATELLEMLCVNLFLFPWKKEIRTLKTFTGPFVYRIQPVLPHSVTRAILEKIGYHPETETEYKLSKSADSDGAVRMGFELFLARQECEYLLEIMGQRGPSECLEIFQQRSSQSLPVEATAGGAEDSGTENVLVPTESEDLTSDGCSLLDPGAPLTEECQASPGTAGSGGQDLEQMPQILEFQASESVHVPRIHPASRRLISEDKSLMEMRESYPDLAFRRRPIFTEPQGCPAAQGRQAGERRTPEGGAMAPVANGDTSTPQSTAGLSEPHPSANDSTASPQYLELAMKLPPLSHPSEKDSTSPPPQGTGQGGVQAGSQIQVAADDGVAELAERMGQLCMREEDLKYPVEETAQPDTGRGGGDGKATPLGSPRGTAQPIVCHPSPAPLCSIPGCGSCVQPDPPRQGDAGPDTITEPPQSFYIPPCTECAHRPLLEGRGSGRADPPSPHSPCSQPPWSHAQQPEDALLEATYVMVERERKEQ